MTQRERWIVYPLLFFCFWMCIKLYWYPPYRDVDGNFAMPLRNIKADSVTCRSLLLKDENGRQLLRAGGRPSGDGYLFIYAAPMPSAPGSAPLEAVRIGVSGNHRGVVETLSEIGQRLVELTSDNRGGNVVLFDAAGRPAVVTHVPKRRAAPPSAADDPRAAPVRPPVPPTAPATVAPASAVGSAAT